MKRCVLSNSKVQHILKTDIWSRYGVKEVEMMHARRYSWLGDRDKQQSMNKAGC